ncbi:phosphonate C-P lyase system protein PhnG [Bacillus mangrovi]|uniref:Phosphonate C-P lyase system protein PhnG n=1 Tax=Metabacillus mangrovi TaxID=1491830 RepID=A0A7X2S5A5_9BACI|nr:phosphonate C-P lyase system protein PhnG [Metabacillus mangrovi]MTH53513.1 phosphonate C-P lyase system protein PhnG [Metabacillus mangrovi]
MKRKRRTEILISGSKELAASMAALAEERHQVEFMTEPENGLVMVKMRETAQNSLFYLGEVFVTECKARVNGTVGIGIVKGHEPELACHLAVIDAAFGATVPETEEWTELLLKEEEAIFERRRAEGRSILKTKVRFETMDTE